MSRIIFPLISFVSHHIFSYSHSIFTYFLYWYTFLFSFISSSSLSLIVLEFASSQDYYAHYILYMRVLGLITRHLSLVSLHFFHPITLGLHYGPCHKTTLRPWDQTLSLTVFIWAGFNDWLNYGCCCAFPYGIYFKWQLVSLPLRMMMFDETQVQG